MCPQRPSSRHLPPEPPPQTSRQLLDNSQGCFLFPLGSERAGVSHGSRPASSFSLLRADTYHHAQLNQGSMCQHTCRTTPFWFYTRNCDQDLSPPFSYRPALSVSIFSTGVVKQYCRNKETVVLSFVVSPRAVAVCTHFLCPVLAAHVLGFSCVPHFLSSGMEWEEGIEPEHQLSKPLPQAAGKRKSTGLGTSQVAQANSL